jgi:hypothetical protein
MDVIDSSRRGLDCDCGAEPKIDPKIDPIPEVTIQGLLDAGLNAFGLQLFIESVAKRNRAAAFKPIKFSYLGVMVTIEPHPTKEIDRRHH